MICHFREPETKQVQVAETIKPDCSTSSYGVHLTDMCSEKTLHLGALGRAIKNNAPRLKMWELVTESAGREFHT